MMSPAAKPKKASRIKVGNFSVACRSVRATKQTVTAIFARHSLYRFNAHCREPLIIDVGSGVGVSTLYFKQLYPQSRILCFEPDIAAFALLKTNLASNRLENVTPLNQAIHGHTGKIKFFGQLFSETSDHRNNSLIEEWACQRRENDVTHVSATKLSDYIQEPTDFLKLDAVGCEEQILEEIAAEEKLGLIKEIVVEIYQAKRIQSINRLSRIVALLKQANFEVLIADRDSAFLTENKDTCHWAKRLKPMLFTLHALHLGAINEKNKPSSVDLPPRF